MKRFSSIFFSFILICCTASEEENEVRKSFNELMNALERKDAGALYDISSSQVKRYFDYLLEKILIGQYKINTYYPENMRKKALDSICWDFAAEAMTGRAFFVATVVPGLIPEVSERMRSVKGIYVAGSHAKVKTESGDLFSFVKDADGVFRTDIFLKAINDLEWVHKVKENLAVLDKNIELIKKGVADL